MTDLIRSILRRLARQWAPGFACFVMALSALACTPTPNPKTVAEARPELVVAYEAAFRAYTYLDARNAALYESHSAAVMGAIKDSVGAFVEACGDKAVICMTDAYDRAMREWEAASGYDKRTDKLEAARQGLMAMRAILETDPNGNLAAWAPAVIATLNAIRALAEELKKAGVPIPEVVDAGMQALKRLA